MAISLNVLCLMAILESQLETDKSVYYTHQPMKDTYDR
jgi:hypothetical protein